MLGQTIRRLRLERGLNQEELGKRIGVSKQSISNWENGNIVPSIDLLVSLAEFFSVSTDYLLGRTERKTLDVSDLNERQTAHLRLLIDDLRGLE